MALCEFCAKENIYDECMQLRQRVVELEQDQSDAFLIIHLKAAEEARKKAFEEAADYVEQKCFSHAGDYNCASLGEVLGYTLRKMGGIHE